MKRLTVLLLLFPLIIFGAGFPARVIRAVPDHWLICHGDSITFGTTLSRPAEQRYSALVTTAVASAKGYRFGEVNYGINGQGLNYVWTGYDAVSGTTSSTFETLIADAVIRVDPFLSKPSPRLVIFAGTSDIFHNGTSGSATWTLLQTYIKARIAAGWPASSICVCTMLPRQSSHETDRTAYNSSIRSNASAIGHVVADLAAEANIGAPGQDQNPTYFSDAIHPTAAGQSIIAAIIQAVLYP